MAAEASPFQKEESAQFPTGVVARGEGLMQPGPWGSSSLQSARSGDTPTVSDSDQLFFSGLLPDDLDLSSDPGAQSLMDFPLEFQGFK